MTLGIIASIALLSVIGVQNATAHQSVVLSGDDHVNSMVFVLGHVDEPTYGNDPGTHEGKHGLELYVRDQATNLMIPQGHAELFFDKYYFENVAAYNSAKSLNDTTSIEREIPINQAYGKPGYYVHRQIIQDGIYGYHVYGTLDYYGVGHKDIDVTMFCGRVHDMDDPTKFENVTVGTTRGEFGCPQSTKELYFPKIGHQSDGNMEHRDHKDSDSHKDKMSDHDDHGKKDMSMTPDVTSMLSDGTQVLIQVSEPIVGERSEINVIFKDAQHVNYDIVVMQGSIKVLDEVDVHDHDGVYEHKTIPLISTSPFDITITFQGYGMADKKPPIGETLQFNRVISTINKY